MCRRDGCQCNLEVAIHTELVGNIMVTTTVASNDREY